jgi:hypothetical protein
MNRTLLVVAALVLVGSAALLFLVTSPNSNATPTKDQFVRQRGGRFFVGSKPFRFVGANVAVMYRDEDRARMPETLRQSAQAGIKVVRVWAYGEGGPNDVKPMADFEDWPREHYFRLAPGQWNEDAFVHLDKVIAEAAMFGELVARHRRGDAVLALGWYQRRCGRPFRLWYQQREGDALLLQSRNATSLSRAR